MLLMVVNRLAGLVLPTSSKFLIDRVLPQHRVDLLGELALAVGLATLVQASTSFGLSQVMSIAAQRAITDLRKSVQEHLLRLPVSYFDSTKTGVLISRVMTDAEGIRNLVGTGIVQLLGGLMTATIALGVLFWLNWKMTTHHAGDPDGVRRGDGGGVQPAAADLPAAGGDQRGGERPAGGDGGRHPPGEDVHGGAAGAAGVHAKGVHKLFRNVAATITAISWVSAVTTVIIGIVGMLLITMGGRAILSGQMTLGDFIMYVFFIGLVAAPLVQIASIGTQVSEAFAGLDRIREVRGLETEDAGDARRRAVPVIDGDVLFDDVSFSYVPEVPVLREISFHAPAGLHDGTGGVERLGQEHDAEPDPGVQPSA